MKILFVRSGNNGIDPVSTNQGESLEKQGHSLIYFNIVGKGPKGYLKNILKLREIVDLEKPDLIHAHYSLSAITASLSFSGIPVVCSLMGSDVNDVSFILKIITVFFVKYIWANTIVKNPEMQKTIGIKNSYILPNGVNLKIFKQIDKDIAKKKLGWESDVKYILFASSPDRPEKNFALAKDAFEGIKNECSKINLTVLNNIPRGEVSLYYNAADVLLLTSLHEGSPNVIKEAMACNCPIVSTDVGDVKEIFGDTEGCYITSFDTDDVAEKIKLALKFGKRTNGRDKISYLDSTKIAQQIINLYSNSLQ